MQQVRPTRRRTTGASAVVAVLAVLVALLVPVGAAPAQAVGRLSISGVTVGCECGGAGYLWGWSSVVVNFEGARKGHTYKVAIKGGPSVAATVYGRTGYAYISREQGRFEEGRTYRLTVKEFRGKRLVRTTAARRYTIPTPVAAPARAHIDTITRGDEEVMVAGETYRITFSGGEWADGIHFASGVDAYFGVARGDDRFGWYQDEGYPLPWQTKGTAPILELTPPEEFVGTRWNIKVIGYRLATETDRSAGLRKGRPIPGSEWGFTFSAKVVAS